MKIFSVSGLVSYPEYQNGRVVTIRGNVVAESMLHAIVLAENEGWEVTEVKVRHEDSFVNVDPNKCEAGFI